VVDSVEEVGFRALAMAIAATVAMSGVTSGRRDRYRYRDGLVTAIIDGQEGRAQIGFHAAKTASCHCAAASALKSRSVDRETRWR
jgi:hypothetical protein